MNATSKRTNEPMIVYEYVGPADVPTRVSPGDGSVYLVDDRGCFEAPAKFAQALHYLFFETRGEARVKPKANGDSRGIGVQMGEDRTKKGVSK
jgi:hypothetical protein